MEQKRGEIAATEGEMQRLSGEKNVLQAAIDNNLANIDRVRTELDEQVSRGSNLSEQIARSEQHIEETGKAIDVLSEALRVLEQDAARLAESSEGIAREYLTLQNKLGDTKSSLAQRLAEAESADAAARDAEERRDTVAKELEEARNRHQELVAAQKDSKRELRQAQ